MKTLKLLFKLVSFYVVTGFSLSSFAQYPAEGSKGFLSFGFAGGIGEYSFLNQDGSSAGYRTTNYLIDLDFQIIQSGNGQVRIFGSYLTGTGKNKTASTDELKASEFVLGLKFYANTHLYMIGGLGQGKTELSRPSSNTITLNYQITKVGLGLEFQIANNIFLGLEGAFQSGALKASENSSLSQNSFYQGSQGFLKLTWIPNMLNDLFTGSTERKSSF